VINDCIEFQYIGAEKGNILENVQDRNLYNKLQFLTLALDKDEWSASRFGRFTLGDKTPVPIG
jgi:hypothetical protein